MTTQPAMYTEIVIPAGAAAIEHRKAILKLLRNLKSFLKHGRLRVPVFGAGGSGKSTFGRLISNDPGTLLAPDTYKESLEFEHYDLPGEFWGAIIVPPGQERRAEVYWPILYNLLAKGKATGVVNVVSYGYNFFKLEIRDTKYYKEKMSDQDFLTTYLDAQRAREIEIIKELLPRLIDAPKLEWMLTLVAKQDLWWTDRARVSAHYAEGVYADQIHQIMKKRGAANFTHEFSSASLVMHNMSDATGLVLAPTTSGYDQSLQSANIASLLRTLIALCRGAK